VAHSSSGLSCRLGSWSEWVGRLRRAYGDCERNPAGDVHRLAGGFGSSVADTVWVSLDGLSDELVDLLDRLSRPDAVRFRGFAARLTPDEPVLIEESAAAAAVRPYGWLLDRLGTDGVRLTSAGYLRRRW
jgi:hypothetical protein